MKKMSKLPLFSTMSDYSHTTAARGIVQKEREEIDY